MGAAVPSRPAWQVPVVLLVLLAAVPAVANAADMGFATSLVTRIMIYAIAALSLDLILGYGAMVSFGHAAFVGIGAYAVGIASAHDLWDATLTFPIAVLAAGLFALATGAISLRTRGVYFIMITLAFGQMAYFTASSLSEYGGDDGLTMWGRSEILGTTPFEDDTAFYYVVLGCLAGCFLFARAMVGSRFGRVIAGVRESRLRMQAVGFNPYAYQLVAYVVAGMMAGLAGALLANHAEFVSPSYMSWQRSGDLIIMVVLGGMGTLHGAVLGAIAYLALEEMLSHVTEHWRVIFGPMLILVVLFARGGLGRLIGRSDGDG
ncbi:MAG: branched-chain amino acid ABC transporter permease [Thalassobaculum sp.]|uniref:branched-chain amino acid ABC transporter permease n=1 Tax=Thalassobaculum sp. TaxID=2022740 RepID=UPI0032EDF8BA